MPFRCLILLSLVIVMATTAAAAPVAAPIPDRIDFNRRSFLVGGTAAGLAFGYVAVEGISTALAAGSFGPTAWYSIGPDGSIARKRTVEPSVAATFE